MHPQIYAAHMGLFNVLTALIVFRDKVLAGIPKAGNPLDYYLASKHMSDEEKSDFTERVTAGSLTDDEKEVIKNLSWCCFEKNGDADSDGRTVDGVEALCLWHGNMKAALREMFTTLGLTQKMWKKAKVGTEGHAGGKQVFQHAVHVDPLRLPFFRPNEKGQDVFITQPDGYIDRVKHIEDAAGKRSVIGRHDYILKPRLQVTLRWPQKGPFDRDDIIRALAACQDDGLGACRSQGFGKFNIIALTDGASAKLSDSGGCTKKEKHVK